MELMAVGERVAARGCSTNPGGQQLNQGVIVSRKGGMKIEERLS